MYITMAIVEKDRSETVDLTVTYYKPSVNRVLLNY